MQLKNILYSNITISFAENLYTSFKISYKSNLQLYIFKYVHIPANTWICAPITPNLTTSDWIACKLCEKLFDC